MMDGSAEKLTSTLSDLQDAARVLLSDPRLEPLPAPRVQDKDGVHDITRSVMSLQQGKGLGNPLHDIDADSRDLDLSSVALLKELFDRTWKGYPTKGLPYDVFTEAFAPIMLPSAARSILKGTALRIDTDANGTIDWEEFSNFLLITHTRKHDETHAQGATYASASSEDILSEVKPSQQHTGASYHKDGVHKILCSDNKYYTASLDGTVKVWNTNSNLSYVTTLHNDSTVSKRRYISDVAHLQASNRIAVVQLDRTITLYDAASHTVHRIYRGVDIGSFFSYEKYREVDAGSGSAGRIGLASSKKKIEVIPVEGMHCAPMCAEVLTGGLQRKLFPSLTEPVFVGFDKGHVHLYNFRKECSRESDQSLKPQHQYRPHSTWVVGLRVCERLDSLLTLSMDQSLKVFNLEKSEEIQSLTGTPECSLLGMDYSEGLNMIATWGASTVCLWNPTLANPTRLRLKAGVVGVRFNSADHHAVVLTEDRLVSIFDVRSSRPLQQFLAKPAGCTDAKCTAVEFDHRRRCILAASNVLVQFPCMRSAGGGSAATEGAAPSDADSPHHSPVNTVLYNDTCEQVTTADAQQVVVWDICTGAKVTAWSLSTHITAMSYDTGLRRLVIALVGGSVGMYNCMTGALLKQCTTDSPFEVNTVHHLQAGSPQDPDGIIAAAGWSSRVLLWDDNTTAEGAANPRQDLAFPSHMGHVYSLCRFPPNRLAVGTSSGAVVIYDLSAMGCTATVLRSIGQPGSSASAALQPSPPASPQPAPPAGMQGEDDFPAFKERAQGCLANIVEAIISLSNTLLCTLHGSGLVVVWRSAKREGSEAVSAFHAPHTAGDEAYAMASVPLRNLLVVGDASGYVTSFSIGGILTAKGGAQHHTQHTASSHLPKKGDLAGGSPLPQPPNGGAGVFRSGGGARGGGGGVRGGARRLCGPKEAGGGGVGAGGGAPFLEAAVWQARGVHNVRVVECFRPHPSVITALQWAASSEVLLVVGGDRTPRLVTLEGVQLATLWHLAATPLPAVGSAERCRGEQRRGTSRHGVDEADITGPRHSDTPLLEESGRGGDTDWRRRSRVASSSARPDVPPYVTHQWVVSGRRQGDGGGGGGGARRSHAGSVASASHAGEDMPGCPAPRKPRQSSGSDGVGSSGGCNDGEDGAAEPGVGGGGGGGGGAVTSSHPAAPGGPAGCSAVQPKPRIPLAPGGSGGKVAQLALSGGAGGGGGGVPGTSPRPPRGGVGGVGGRPLTARAAHAAVRSSRPASARVPGTSRVGSAGAARAEVAELLVHPRVEGGAQAGGGGVVDRGGGGDGGGETPCIDLASCRRARVLHWSKENDFTPHGLDILRPPTFMATPIRPSPHRKDRSPQREATCSAGQRSPKEGGLCEAVTAHPQEVGTAREEEEEEEGPRKFFSQYKEIMMGNGTANSSNAVNTSSSSGGDDSGKVDVSETGVDRLMDVSHTMQATRFVKHTDLSAPQQGVRTALSYSKLLTSPLSQVQASKPFSESAKNRRKHLTGPFASSGSNNPSLELYMRC